MFPTVFPAYNQPPSGGWGGEVSLEPRGLFRFACSQVCRAKLGWWWGIEHCVAIDFWGAPRLQSFDLEVLCVLDEVLAAQGIDPPGHSP
eukprot:4923593-Amphidinium_carterae.1